MAWANKGQDKEQSKGYKADSGKIRMELLPPGPLRQAAQVFTYGAEKYAERPEASANNWLGGMRYGRMYGALQRHLSAWWSGEETDLESGLPHLAHALCCLMMLSEYARNPRYAEFDDRPTPENVSTYYGGTG